MNSIHPGDIDTPMIAGHEDSDHVVSPDAVPMWRFGLPDEVASLALFPLSDESSFITGAEHMIDGGYTAA